MSDRARTVVQQFLRGECDLTDLTARLEDVVAADPSAATALRAHLADLYRGGQLPLPVHDMLSATAVRASREGAVTECAWSDSDSTVADATQPIAAPSVRASVAAAAEPTDRTSVMNRDDPTHAPAVRQGAPRGVDPTADRTVQQRGAALDDATQSNTLTRADLTVTPTVAIRPAPDAELTVMPTVAIKSAAGADLTITPTVAIRPAPDAELTMTPTVAIKPAPSADLTVMPTVAITPAPNADPTATPTVTTAPASRADLTAAQTVVTPASRADLTAAQTAVTPASSADLTAAPTAAVTPASRPDRTVEPTAAMIPAARPDPTAEPTAAFAAAPMARPTVRPTAGPTDGGSDWSHPERWRSRGGRIEVGSVVKDRFVLESVLGRGGMGVVYRAFDRRKQEALDRDPYVALKILNDKFRAHPRALIALQREARKAQTLAHPNVITVHDFDRDGTTVYMTMELLDGEPLSATIRDHKLDGLPRERATATIRGIATALAYAHRKGIVHSDLKPGNVFITSTGDVKVLDFGIARAVPTKLRPDADRTVFDATAMGALTPAYASLEMLQGASPEPADDVFALGLVAHELLTGHHPFDKAPANDARTRGLKPSGAIALPRRQRAALAKALSFERAQRQPDAAAFLADFDGPSPIKKAAYAAALVTLAGVATYAFYLNDQIRPDIPFEQLSAKTQQQFTQAIAQGAQGLRFGALNDSFEFYARAYELHRNNPEAIQGLETVANRFLVSMLGVEETDQRAVLQKLYCQEYLSTYDPVVTACKSALGDQCSAFGLRCPSTDGQ